MMRRAKSGFLFLLTLALLVVSTGCPDSTPVDSGNAVVKLAVLNSNAGTWAYGSFSINLVAFRPLDPEASNRLGGRNLLLLNESVFVDNSTSEADPDFFPDVVVPSGAYEIVRLEIADVYFDTFGNYASTTECEQIFVYNMLDMVGTGLTFTVQHGVDTPVRFNFDLQAMADEIENAFTTAQFYPFCEGDVNVATITASLGNFLTID